MSDQQFVIDFGDEGQGVVETDERSWLEERVRREPGSTRLRLSLDDYDTEGHRAASGTLVRVIVDDDDTEGHALAIHFPTVREADAFRKRLMVTGVLVGTVAIGTATGAGLASLQSDAGSSASSATSISQTGPMDVHEAPAFAVGAAATQTGPMDAHEAPAFGVGAAAQTGPMDVHEAPAFEGLSAADQAYADRLSGQAAAAQTGPMDVHEAPAFQGGSSADEADDTSSGLGGPTPR